jgi:hypothetical protein
MKKHLHNKKWLIIFLTLLTPGIFFVNAVYAGTLSCSVTSTCNSPNVVVFKMYATVNSHAELPSQSNYANLVCCGGVTGLGNSCTGTYAIALKLAKATNAHVEQNSFLDYTSSTCIQAPSGGTVSVAYQSSTCLGYDTTVASMATSTNSHVGNAGAYTTKICASAAPQATVTCATNVASTSFSALTSGIITQASPNVSTTLSCSNTASGCTLYAKDAGNASNAGLWSSGISHLIPSPNAAFAATSTLVIGTEGYGIRVATDTAGSGSTLTIAPRYLQSGNTVGGFSLASIPVASSTADMSGREIIVTHLAAISALTPSGNYADTITYSCTAN